MDEVNVTGAPENSPLDFWREVLRALPLPGFLFSPGIGCCLGALAGALASGAIGLFFSMVADLHGNMLEFVVMAAVLGAGAGLVLGTLAGLVLYYLGRRGGSRDQVAFLGAALCGAAGALLGIIAGFVVMMILGSTEAGLRLDWFIAAMMIGAGIASTGGWVLGQVIQWRMSFEGL